jgi:hypothetical protein
MKIWFSLLSFFLYQDVTCNNTYYILFTNEYPKSYFRMDTITKEKNFAGTFSLVKVAGDGCSINTFWFFKYPSEKSIVKVKIDTLQNVITAEWVATQPDSILSRLFRHKDIYIIPKDSLKANEGNAYLTTYHPFEYE